MIAGNDNYRTPSDVWARIAAPLPPGVISWRQDGKPISRDGKFIARFVAFVEANTVRERLDSVVPGEWDLTLTPLPKLEEVGAGGEVESSLFAFKARLQILGVVREDVGQGNDYKSAATDAFKRASVRFGIAHELYGYGSNWVEVDGDGKYAKPLEDPGAAYARKNGGGSKTAPASIPTSGDAAGESTPAPTDAARSPLNLEEEKCPKCGGRMWDNRLTKRNPKAPDFKCRNRSCDGVIWPEQAGGQQEAIDGNGNGDGPGLEDWPPLPGAALVPDEADLPF